MSKIPRGAETVKNLYISATKGGPRRIYGIDEEGVRHYIFSDNDLVDRHWLRVAITTSPMYLYDHSIAFVNYWDAYAYFLKERAESQLPTK